MPLLLCYQENQQVILNFNRGLNRKQQKSQKCKCVFLSECCNLYGSHSLHELEQYKIEFDKFSNNFKEEFCNNQP